MSESSAPEAPARVDAPAVPRADMIQNAVSFLADPKVQSSPISQRISFLESKGLTPQEVDMALAQASRPQAMSPQYSSPYPMMPAYPPVQSSRRDWRDWFIMAVVSGTIGYGIFGLARVRLLDLHSDTCTLICSLPTSLSLRQSAMNSPRSTTKLHSIWRSLTRPPRPSVRVLTSIRLPSKRVSWALMRWLSKFGRAKSNAKRTLKKSRPKSRKCVKSSPRCSTAIASPKSRRSPTCKVNSSRFDRSLFRAAAWQATRPSRMPRATRHLLLLGRRPPFLHGSLKTLRKNK